MFAGSNVLYLAIRKAQIEKIDTSVYSIGLFGIPCISYFLLATFSGVSLMVSISQFAIIILTALGWSYLGNYFSQRGILYAPNPGYSLVIQKSYVILTTLISVILFSSEISIQKVVAVLLIILFAGVISISGKKKEAQGKWILFSLGAHLCFAFGSLMSKHFLNLGWSPYLYLFYITLTVSLLSIFEAKKKKVSLKLNKKQLMLILIIGLASVFFNLFMQFAYGSAPNPGYVVAINTSSILALTLLSAYLYKDDLSRQKLIGVLGVTVGLLLLIFS